MIATILAISASIFVYFVKDKSQNIQNSVSLEVPDYFASWQFDQGLRLDWQPIFTRPDVSVSRSYVYQNEPVQLNIAYYQTQRQGAEAISSSNTIVNPPGGEWKKIKSSEIDINGMHFTETEVREPQSDVLVWHWYKIGEFETLNPYVAKALDAYNLIVKGKTDAAMITISTRLDNNIVESRQRIQRFWNSASITLNNLPER